MYYKNSPYYLLDKNNLIWVHKWASLIAQLVKNSPAAQEIPVGFLGREVPLERKSYPLQYSWASLVAELVKNPPAMRETYTKGEVLEVTSVFSLWRKHLPTGPLKAQSNSKWGKFCASSPAASSFLQTCQLGEEKRKIAPVAEQTQTGLAMGNPTWV